MGLTLLGLALGVGIWELVALAIGVPLIMPSPLQTAQAFVYYLQHPYPTQGYTLWGHALFSLERVFIGYAAGVTAGILLGSVMAAVRPLRRLVDPLIESARVLPMIAFIPMFVVWFGIGDMPKVVLIAVAIVPIMVVSVAAALDRFPMDMVNAARCLGASDSYALVHVRIRGSAPAILTGMRLSMGVSWGNIVAAEMIVATSGLGYVVLEAGIYLQTALIFAGIISIVILGLLCDLGLRMVLRAVDPVSREAVR
ncbi:MAG: ABC transporter permease [Candidatus Dormibacteraceae bacterium]